MTVSPTDDSGLVSVIVIFKDAEQFLAEAVESVRDQTHREWELLLVDDGSTDASTRIAQDYVAREPARVRYVEHAGHVNRGMSATRNLGLAHARGDFVAFVDADDVLVATALEDQTRILRSHPRVGMVYGPLEYWFGWTGEPDELQRDFVHPVGVPSEAIYEPPSLIAALFLENVAFSPSGMLVRRGVVEQVGGFDESFRDLYEDQIFAAKVCRATHVYVSSRCWYRYRQHPDSCCMVALAEGRLDASRKPFLRWLVAYLEREGLRGSEAWHVARLQLRSHSATRRLLGRAARAPRLVSKRAIELGTRRGR